MKTILGIETSCDECSAALIAYGSVAGETAKESGRNSIRVLSTATFSQIKLHQPFGGVVPEVASRNHLETINEMIDQALKVPEFSREDLQAIAVTNRPGLVGALLVGVSAAKALAYAWQKPLVPVHHLEGHAVSVFLDREPRVEYPLLLALVSGGHTNLYCVKEPPEKWNLDFLKSSLVGRSRDDAAGEAFDKTAKLLGFPYPGGVWIDQMAQKGNPKAYALPVALPQKSTFDFSFSGLKTAAALLVDQLKKSGTLREAIPDVCASIQAAIVHALLSKIYLAAKEYKCRSLAVVGGVAANSELRNALAMRWKDLGLHVPPFFPDMKYCTDNAAMIAAAGAFRFQQGYFLDQKGMLSLNAIANPET